MKDIDVFDSSDLSRLPKLPKRPSESHKGSFGRVLCVCGSEGMAGAAYLSAKAAYRSGAGLVEIFTPRCNREVLQTLLPEAIVTVYDPSDHRSYRCSLASSLKRADACVCGCGLGNTLQSKKLLSILLDARKCPLVLDADALNIISDDISLIALAKGAVITPHIKEMARLVGAEPSEVAKDTAAIAGNFANGHSLICVLKSHNTVVTDGEGRTYVNRLGNSGMATGGSGDVLAGVIGAMLAGENGRMLSHFESAVIGVCLHSIAGDLAAKRLGEHSLMASDIIDFLYRAIEEYKK